MLSLSQFRHHLFPVFMLMKGTGATYEVIYKGKVYEVYVKPSHKKPQYTRPRRPRPVTKVLPHRIDIVECDKCGSLLIAGVCMNSKCLSQ